MKEKYSVYVLSETEENIKELDNHLKMNGYDYLILGKRLYVHEDEVGYVETIMDDRSLYYSFFDNEWR